VHRGVDREPRAESSTSLANLRSVPKTAQAEISPAFTGRVRAVALAIGLPTHLGGTRRQNRGREPQFLRDGLAMDVMRVLAILAYLSRSGVCPSLLGPMAPLTPEKIE